MYNPVKKDNPLVSVTVQTYQHSPYIRECLDSILMQKTKFFFEIVLGEDGSTDGTREICMEYAKKYPDIIRLSLNTRENVICINGRPTGRRNFMNNLKNARGKYIANVPGDDYWTDPLKLQKQVDILDKYNDIVACHHGYWSKNELNGNSFSLSKVNYNLKTITSVGDIFDRKVIIQLKTIMFRNIIDEHFFPDWFEKVMYGDLAFPFLLGKHGDFYFIAEPMAVYRITGKGLSRTGLPEMQRPYRIIEHYSVWIDIWKKANKYYDYRFNKQAVMAILSFYYDIFKLIIRKPRRKLREWKNELINYRNN